MKNRLLVQALAVVVLGAVASVTSPARAAASPASTYQCTHEWYGCKMACFGSCDCGVFVCYETSCTELGHVYPVFQACLDYE